MSFTDFLEDELLDHVFGGANRIFTPPTNLFCALSTIVPTDSGSGFTEPADGYLRVSTSDSDWTIAGTAPQGSITNSNAIIFPQASGTGWGTILFAALFDLATVGNNLMQLDVVPDVVVNSGDDSQFAALAFTTTLT